MSIVETVEVVVLVTISVSCINTLFDQRFWR